jgi:hypothetical protein
MVGTSAEARVAVVVLARAEEAAVVSISILGVWAGEAGRPSGREENEAIYLCHLGRGGQGRSAVRHAGCLGRRILAQILGQYGCAWIALDNIVCLGRTAGLTPLSVRIRLGAYCPFRSARWRCA